jgi:hypothetical protein
MVQWTDKPAPAPKPQAAPEERKPEAAPRTVVRKARKRGLAGSLQVLTICCVFGAIVVSVFMFKEMRAAPDTPSAAAQKAGPQRDTTTGRIVVMDRDQCRELNFDNQSGKTIERGAVACHDAPHANAGNSLYRHPTNRMDHIRRSFAQ